jgi:Helix-turn-helix domain, rpiR family
VWAPTATVETPAPLLSGPELVKQLEQALPRLSPKLREVARFCLVHRAQIHRARIQDVATRCNTVPASVVRLAKQLGHEGFHSFKFAFMDAVPGPGGALRPDDVQAQASSAARHWLSQFDDDLDRLADLRSLIVDEVFSRALSWIHDSPALTITYQGEFDRLIALHLGNVLHRLGKVVMLADRTRHPAPDRTHLTMDIQIEDQLPEQVTPDTLHPATERAGRRIEWVWVKDPGLPSPPSAASLATLPIGGQRLGQRVQKALAMIEVIEVAFSPEAVGRGPL